jgi:poly(3-hydroxybutyrate) depolymerase
MLSLLPVLYLQVALKPIVLTEGLAVSRVTEGGRNPAPKDALVAELVATPTFSPTASKLPWRASKANAEGWFEGLGGGYLWSTFAAPTERVMILEATGHGMVYINGQPRAGDPYAYGYLKQPFLAKGGENTLLFSGGRGRVKAQVVAPRAPLQFDTGDLTLPDILRSDKGALFGAIVVLNNTDQPVTDLRLSAKLGGKTVVSDAPVISPLTSRKVRFDFPVSASDTTVELKLLRGGRILDTATVTIGLKEANQHYKRTFVSSIDGSVQYFGVSPALKPSKANALVLTLHGASVEGIGQAQAYAPKEWATVVAATNRRPYGFDWEDTGRLDALEVLSIAERTFPHDPKRVFVTGHSMGGHGTWHIGTMFPDRFGAMAPSAGWISFWSYGGGWEPRDPTPVEEVLRSASNPSDTLGRMRNLKELGVYILHGDADDNVPVSQARSGRAALRSWHRDLQYHEQPGAGHWWGNECVDWPGIFEMFKTRSRELDPNRIEFITQNPGISGKYAWLTIEQAMMPEKPSAVTLERLAPVWTRVSVEGKTDNVACLTLRVSPETTIRLDGQDLGKAFALKGFSGSSVGLKKVAGTWQSLPASALATQKNASRSGTFKQAFQNRMVFVYGTKGSREESAWAYAKARYDAETFYYRGNGSVDVIADTVASSMPLNDRNIILYGNADTNSQWTRFLRGSPIYVDRGGVTVGPKRHQGADMGALFLRPSGTGKQLIGVVAGSGLVGSRVLDRAPVFVSGVAYPDWTVLSPAALTEGTKGVLGAGYFANDWSFLGLEAWR